MSPLKNLNTAISSQLQSQSASTIPATTAAFPTSAALLESKDRRTFETERKRALKPTDRGRKSNNYKAQYQGNVGRNARYKARGDGITNRRWGGIVTSEDLDTREDYDPQYSDVDEDDLISIMNNGESPLTHASLYDLIRPERRRNGKRVLSTQELRSFI